MRSPRCSCAALRSSRSGSGSTPSGSRSRKSARRSARTRLLLLPRLQLPPCAVDAGVHGPLVVAVLGGELDHVAVRIAEVDRVDEAGVGDAANLHAGGLAVRQPPLQLLLAASQT